MARAHDPDHLTLADACETLRLSPRTLERWAADGRIPSMLTADGMRIFRRSDLLSRSVTPGDVASRRESNGGDNAN